MKARVEQLIRDATRGIAEFGHGSHGLSLHRLPANLAMYHDVDALTQKVADQASGARIALLTTASEITLTYRATRDVSEDGTFESAPSSVTLTSGDYSETISHTNGNRRLWDAYGASTLQLGEDSVARFNLPATSQARDVDIWLPHNCNIEIVDLVADAPLEPAVVSQPRWVHYGSSISHCIEADEPTGVWPVVAARELGLDLFNLGLAGSANLEYFAAEFIASQPADLITLKLGINTVNGNHMHKRVFVPAVHSFLDAIRAKHPTTPIVVISPVFCEAHEHNPGPSRQGADGRVRGSEPSDLDWIGELTLVSIREILSSVVERRADPNLRYLSGLELFSSEDAALMPDGLHPNAAGYRLTGQRFARLDLR
jgi:lysophospholipase L1-like esterase